MAQDYGIKISVPGVDVGTATVTNLIFSSAYDYLKIKLNGSGSITIPAAVGFTNGSAMGTITHNLGYYPAFIVFLDATVWGFQDRYSPYTTRSIGVQTPVDPLYYVGTQNLIIKVFNPGNAQTTMKYRYHIYDNKLT